MGVPEYVLYSRSGKSIVESDDPIPLYAARLIVIASQDAYIQGVRAGRDQVTAELRRLLQVDEALDEVAE